MDCTFVGCRCVSALRSQPRRRAKIGLTALIDVVFILLLFFMLSTSFSHWQSLSVGLKVGNARSQSSPTETITMLSAKAILIAGQTIEYESLATLQLSNVSWFSPDTRYLLKPLKTTPVQDIVDVMAGLGAAGVQNIHLSKVQHD